jgi:NAD(P)-dependent dehydrogenase (short-subunit alcohol dehydrogenase family)
MFPQQGDEREEHFSNTTKDHLIPRVGQPEEVAAGAIFLLENQFVTGTIVDVDGGAILS